MLEGKADIAQVEHVTRLLELKVDNAEILAVKHELANKSERADVDLYVRAVQGQRNDFETR